MNDPAFGQRASFVQDLQKILPGPPAMNRNGAFVIPRQFKLMFECHDLPILIDAVDRVIQPDSQNA